ncbi:hypothetical protein ILYODFUR_029018, partial [Ilyodon furcidens]
REREREREREDKKISLLLSCCSNTTQTFFYTYQTHKTVDGKKPTVLTQIHSEKKKWKHLCFFKYLFIALLPEGGSPAVDISQGRDRGAAGGGGGFKRSLEMCWTVRHVTVHKARTMQSAGGSVAQGQGGHRYRGN